jgi:hypothetical protein
VPQIRWNDTIALRGWSRPAGSKADIATPVASQIVRADGLVISNLTLNWTAESSDASRNNGSPDRRLMDGFVRAYNTTPVSLSLSNIPFARYDLYVHVGGSYDGQHGRIRLGNNPATDRFFETITTARYDRKLAFKESSTVMTLPVKRGTAVKKGDILIQLEDREGESLVELYRLRANADVEVQAAVVRSTVGGQFAVAVIEQNGTGTVAKLRPVELGEVIGNAVANTKGVSPGERVVVSGATLLVDGAPIRVLND